MARRFVVGIDLGTTNSVLAYTPLDIEKPQVEVFEIPQFVAPGSLERLSVLPSFAFLPPEEPSGSEAFRLPWPTRSRAIIGEFARLQSAEFPERTVVAAKSWLCYRRADRHQPILPWNAPEDVPKISPVTASQRFLEHLAGAWDAAFPDAPIREQLVVLTVPASFDAVARELTREAALAAGLPDELVLLEEPQAAFYAWLASVGDSWRKRLKLHDRLLVCDVGGGTTDLTLIEVAEEAGELVLQRVAVGKHLLVGGDNMDLALAHWVAERFREKGIDLDPWQSIALWHSCRAAKEKLLGDDAPERTPVTILGRGRRLVGGTQRVDVEREHVLQFLTEGFFPACDLADRPRRQARVGFQELGLPYEPDTAITRHVAAFLTDHGADAPARPTHVLFNGGVFKAPAFRRRVLEVLQRWFPDHVAQSLLDTPFDFDHAVARGAAYYGWAKKHGGVRIRGGTARSYYIGIESAGLAIPGAPRPLRALCVVPFGMEEGTECDVPSSEIGLVHGEPAQFRFFSSAVRKQDRPGDILTRWSEEELVETTSLETTLPADEAIDEPYVPVKFRSRITEVGMLELWCVSTRTPGRWKLEFSVRDEPES
ncbi:MAG: molecular chaperone DnaK [Pirellulaceae bacterium]|nr:MAG: molecular chaperone DnaK [Pirellulaceae bacterium]